MPGIGEKTAAKILAALEQERLPRTRGLLLPRARALTEAIAAALGGIAAGDARRWLDVSTHLAVVVPSDDPGAMRERFAALPEIVALLDPDTVSPPTAFRSSSSWRRSVRSEPRSCGPPDRPSMSRHSAPSRPPATRKRSTGYSVWAGRRRDSRSAARYGAPAARRAGRRSVGDLHAHTVWSDGRATVLEMGVAARDRGHEYLAICDHTPGVTVVAGLDGDALRRQGEEIAAANEQLAPFRILRGVECDIRTDGSLDIPEDVLLELDWVQISLHRGQRAARAELTARVVEAMRHPAARCLSHPTGRLIGHRPENALDLERTIEAAIETGVALEVNGLANRLDLAGEHVRLAVEAGVQIVCSTDAHSIRGLDNMELAVRTARRGRATAGDVLNTRPLSALARRQASSRATHRPA